MCFFQQVIWMLDFGLYCDLMHDVAFKKEKYTQENFIALASKFAEEKEGQDVFFTLINSCNKKDIEQLINYFDPDAPVQKLLAKKLDEISKEENKKELNENDVIEYKKLTRIKPSFFNYLADLISQKGFTEPDFYNYIGMSRQTFAKIRKNDTISRNHILLMAVALELDYKQAVDFLGKAGFIFQPYDNREAFISYVMRNKKYTLESMEEMLFFMGEKPLMSV